MPTDVAEIGLRERKRLATRRAIQRAVLTLVCDRGLDRVTIDDISAEADISPRTFFNYFASKEEALIGDTPSLPPQDYIDRFIAAEPSGDILDDLCELLVWATDTSEGDLELQKLRRSVLKDYPQMFGTRMASMRQFENTITDIVVQRLANSPGFEGFPPADLREHAHLVTLVGSAAMRHAWSSWADQKASGSLSTRMRASFAALHSIR